MTATTDTALYDEEHRYAGGGFRIHVDPSCRATLSFWGKGSNEGTDALIRALEVVAGRVRALQRRMTCIVDLGELKGTPIMSQLRLGKWLLGHKQLVEKIAIYGGSPVEVKVAKAVMAMARMDNVGFFQAKDDALRWLGW